MKFDTCPICQSEMSQGNKSWHFICANCHYEKSNLKPEINDNSRHELINESSRASGLRELRVSNFKEILEKITRLKPNGGSLLEVGSAHGWFLDLARSAFKVSGLEPDEDVFESSVQRGVPARKGYFPDALDNDEVFDVIVFNDVIEHIPDIKHTLESCWRHLKVDGLLVINLPCSSGVFYRTSKFLMKFGFSGFFDRLWNKSLPSPHLHYLNSVNVALLLEQSGFHVKTRGALPSLTISGLWRRITYTGKYNILSAVCIYIAIVVTFPFLKLMPSDIVFVVSARD